jgi:RNase P subunit RPR2
MFYRKDRTAPVWREVPKEKIVNTVFLTKDVKTKFCPKCKKYHPVVDFYIESKSKRKHSDQLRNMCVDCWDIYFGRLSPVEEVQEGIDVFGEKFSVTLTRKSFKRKKHIKPDLVIDFFIGNE